MSEEVGHIEVTYRHKNKSDETFKKIHSLGDFKAKDNWDSSFRSDINITDMSLIMENYYHCRVEIVVFNNEKLVSVKVNTQLLEEIYLRGWNIDYFRYHNSKARRNPIRHNNIKYIDLEGSSAVTIHCFDLPPYTKMRVNEEVNMIVVTNVVDIINLENVIEQNPDVDVRLREPGNEQLRNERGNVAFGIEL